MVSCDDLHATSALVPFKQQLSRHHITSEGEVETPLSTVPRNSRKPLVSLPGSHVLTPFTLAR